MTLTDAVVKRRGPDTNSPSAFRVLCMFRVRNPLLLSHPARSARVVIPVAY